MLFFYDLCTRMQIISLRCLHFVLLFVSFVASSLFSLLQLFVSFFLFLNLLHFFFFGVRVHACVCVTSRETVCSEEPE